jgi:hypothetical protein
LEIQGKVIEQVINVKYLGVEVTSDGAQQSEVKHQAYKAARLCGCLNDTIWRNKYLRQETEMRSYKSVIRPVLTYAAETRADT